MANESKPEVAVVMGSASDWETMKRACDILDQFGVAYHKQVKIGRASSRERV